MLQDEGGASRDEIAAALVEVAEGRVPKDRIALRELYREIMEWPFVEAAPEEEEGDNGASTSSPYEAITPTGVEGTLWKPQDAPGWNASTCPGLANDICGLVCAGSASA